MLAVAPIGLDITIVAAICLVVTACMHKMIYVITQALLGIFRKFGNQNPDSVNLRQESAALLKDVALLP